MALRVRPRTIRSWGACWMPISRRSRPAWSSTPRCSRPGTRRSPRACGRVCRYFEWPSRSKPVLMPTPPSRQPPFLSWATFEILRMIGRGGMGIVFEAEQISLRRNVALKVLPFAAALDPEQLRRFEIEARAAAQLHHTNIVPIFSVGCERGVHYYAMQHIKGQTLAAIIKDLRRLSRPDSLSKADLTATGHSLTADIVTGRFAPSVKAGAASAAGIHGRAFLARWLTWDNKRPRL